MLYLGDTYTIQDLKWANRRAGQHFFDKKTMEFFRSIVYKHVFKGAHGWYFITSEQYPGWGNDKPGPRRFTIRQMYPCGSVLNASDFMAYPSLSAALADINNIVELSYQEETLNDG